MFFLENKCHAETRSTRGEKIYKKNFNSICLDLVMHL